MIDADVVISISMSDVRLSLRMTKLPSIIQQIWKGKVNNGVKIYHLKKNIWCESYLTEWVGANYICNKNGHIYCVKLMNNKTWYDNIMG